MSRCVYESGPSEVLPWGAAKKKVGAPPNTPGEPAKKKQKKKI